MIAATIIFKKPDQSLVVVEKTFKLYSDVVVYMDKGGPKNTQAVNAFLVVTYDD
jgi:hypothetical protein